MSFNICRAPAFIYGPFTVWGLLYVPILGIEPCRLMKDERRKSAVQAKTVAAVWIRVPKRKKGESGKDDQ
jgi:hypothetical protein